MSVDTQGEMPRFNYSDHESLSSGPWRPLPRSSLASHGGLRRSLASVGLAPPAGLIPPRSEVPFKSLSPNKTPLYAPPWESGPSPEEALSTGAAALLHPFGNNNGRPDERERGNQVWKIPQSCNVNRWAPGLRAAAVLPPRALVWDCTPGGEERRGLISWFSDSACAWRVGEESLRLGSEATLDSKGIPFHYQSRNRIARGLRFPGAEVQ